VYVIVKGEAKVVNRYDNQRLCKLLEGDYFGISYFLRQERYSYFGDIVASASASGGSYDRQKTVGSMYTNSDSPASVSKLDKKKSVYK
jgi:hypothetical protein